MVTQIHSIYIYHYQTKLFYVFLKFNINKLTCDSPLVTHISIIRSFLLQSNNLFYITLLTSILPKILFIYFFS